MMHGLQPEHGAVHAVRRLTTPSPPIRSAASPIRWDEVDDADPRDFTIATVPERFARLGDLHADIDDHVFDIAPLLAWAARDEAAGQEAPDETRR